MTRLVLALAAVIAIHATEPVDAGWRLGGFRNHCGCADAQPMHVVFEGYGAAEGYGGFDAYEGYSHPISPPANHAYGYVDNSHKPWSLSPGDGYVGATVSKADKKDKDDQPTSDSDTQEKSAPLTPLPDTTVPPAPLPSVEPLDLSPSDSAIPTPDVPDSSSGTPEPPQPTENKDQAQGQTLERNQMPTLYEIPERNYTVPTPYEPQSGGTTSGDSLSLPPTPTSASLVHTLLGFSVVMLGFGGHYARKTSQVIDNEAPIARI